jgi:hypothetical protein
VSAGAGITCGASTTLSPFGLSLALIPMVSSVGPNVAAPPATLSRTEHYGRYRRVIHLVMVAVGAGANYARTPAPTTRRHRRRRLRSTGCVGTSGADITATARSTTPGLAGRPRPRYPLTF